MMELLIAWEQLIKIVGSCILLIPWKGEFVSFKQNGQQGPILTHEIVKQFLYIQSVLKIQPLIKGNV